MTDLVWPADLVPYKVAFYLQAHVGGTESPFSRQRKVYGLSAPRWVARLTFRGGYWGGFGAEAYGPRLDALLADLAGTGRIAIWDFRRPAPQRPQFRASLTALATPGAAKGATQMIVTGFSPGAIAFTPGDYIGGDGRAHIVTGLVFADATGAALTSFRPPLAAAVPAGAVPVERVTSPFRLAPDGADDAGANETEVGQATEYTLSFVEDLGSGA